MTTLEKVSSAKSVVESEKKSTNSIGPIYSFFECNGNYIVQFGSTSGNGILHDIEKRTSKLHNAYNRKKDTYINSKETACGGWAVRALGLIDDESLNTTICERRKEKKGLNNLILIDKLNPYFNGKLEKKNFNEDIETLLEKIDPGHATIIYAKYNSIAKQKVKESGLSVDSHIILLIKTELIEDPDNPDDPEDPGAYILYDPSQFNPKLRILYNGYDTSMTISDYLTSKTYFEKIATCFGTTRLEAASEVPGKKMTNIAFGRKIKKYKKSKRSKRSKRFNKSKRSNKSRKYKK
jgi:hypothetical protein